MTDRDPYLIEDIAALREVVGDQHPSGTMKIHDHLDEFAVAFLARSPFLVLTTADADGNLDASPKGDVPGFVEVVNGNTLLIPDRPGNKLVFGHQNILVNPRIGLLFLVPGTPETVRINGSAELTSDPELLARLSARGKPAVLAIRVHIQEYFFHCAKAFIRAELWKPESWPERQKISFGEMFKKWAGVDDDASEALDAAIEEDYRSNL